MIEYKFKEEKEILLHYAKLLNDQAALNILQKNEVDSEHEVQTLAKFYWDMVDLNVKESESATEAYSDMEKRLERIYTSFHIYLNTLATVKCGTMPSPHGNRDLSRVAIRNPPNFPRTAIICYAEMQPQARTWGK